jgi:hypothetical protein
VEIILKVYFKNQMKSHTKAACSWAWWCMTNPSTGEAEAGGLWVQGQPGLHSETLFKKTQKNGNVVVDRIARGPKEGSVPFLGGKSVLAGQSWLTEAMLDGVLKCGVMSNGAG